MKKRFLCFVLMAGLVVGTACKKDKDENGNGNGNGNGGDLPAEQSQNLLERTSREMQADLSELLNSEGADAIVTLANNIGEDDFSEFSKRTVSNTDFRAKAKTKAKAFKQYFTPNQKSFADEPVTSLEDMSGEWELVNGEWEKIRDHERLILHFPAPADNPINNATFTWTAYETQSVQGDDWPSKIGFSLKLDGTRYASVDFDATYNSDGEPVNVDYTLYLKPFTSTFEFKNQNNKVEMNTSFSKDGSGEFFTTSNKATFDNGGIDEGDVLNASTSIRYNELVFKADMDVQGMDSDHEGSEVERMNKYVNAKFKQHPSNSLVGELFFEEGDYEGSIDVFIKYNDGTSEPLIKYLDPILDDMEGFFTDAEQARMKSKVRKKLKLKK
ncbi:hypothetical protein RCC89_04510 [Cytophagaceae bacterium ABcell3]|nr:hypothetical protein RCC89_04510 [Cytophagaceae bacterium ABcell3]